MIRWPWRRRLDESAAAVERAEHLRNAAQHQQSRVQAIEPQVDALSTSLRKLRDDNHFSPLIDAILRGSE